jgi:hypothetical protein
VPGSTGPRASRPERHAKVNLKSLLSRSISFKHKLVNLPVRCHGLVIY